MKNEDDVMGPVREIYRLFANDDELWKLLAKMVRKMYDALIEEGFSPEQAGVISSQAMSSFSKKAG